MNISPGKSLPQDHNESVHNQDGQSLVEFVLLLLVIVTLSFGFIRVANGNLGEYWKAYVRLIVDDPSQNASIDF